MKFYKNKVFYLYCLLTLVFFGILFMLEYATDTYVVAQDVKGYSDWMLSIGRPVISLLFLSFGSISNSIYPPYYFSTILAIVLMPIILYRAYKLFLPIFKNKFFAIFFPFLLIVNPFVIEYYLFLEKGFFILGILLTILAIEQFNKVLEKKYINLIFVFLFECVVVFTYQIMIALFAVLAICLIVSKIKKIKPFIGFTGIAIGVYAAACIPLFIFMKVYPSSSRTGSGIYFSNIWKILNAGGPIVFAIGLILIIGFTFLLAWLRQKYQKDNRSYWVCFGIYAFLFIGSFAAVLSPYIFTDPESAVPAYRTLYPLIVLVVYIIMEFGFKNNEETNAEIKPIKEAKKWQFASIIGVICLEFGLFATIFAGRYINNFTDENEIRQIGDYIKNYESTSGNTITKLSFYKDSNSHYSHKGAVCLGINLKSFMTDWSDSTSVNYYLSKNYTKVDNDPTVYDTYFKGKTYDSFNYEQIVFTNDICHIYVY